MKTNISRRTFMKNIIYLTLGLPLFSAVTKWLKTDNKKTEIKPHPARYYKELAG